MSTVARAAEALRFEGVVVDVDDAALVRDELFALRDRLAAELRGAGRCDWGLLGRLEKIEKFARRLEHIVIR